MQRERSDKEEVDCRCSICRLAGPDGRVQTRVIARRHAARDLHCSTHPNPNPSFPAPTQSDNTRNDFIFQLDNLDDEPEEEHDDLVFDGSGSGGGDGFEAEADSRDGDWGRARVRFELDLDEEDAGPGHESDEDELFVGTGQANGAGPVFENITDDPLYREQSNIWEQDNDDGPDTSSGNLDLPPAFSESALRRNFYVHVFLGSAFEHQENLQVFNLL
ncbi:hypothetical protein BDN72DRAFT_905836 [Pluteus cervinus]|uniref:Uncharacterized protein n=1 Tax=Pluteus cervinus TaxID=181527 RepID=A0ACD3A1F0_9AGAR|nr:hypothetical protein BDN72DRAFT_905836 [Pluteus cervinus]